MPQMLFIMFASIIQAWLVLSILVILDHRVHKELKVDKDIKVLKELKELRESRADPAFQRVLVETRLKWFLRDGVSCSIEDVLYDHGNRFLRIKEMLRYGQFMRPAKTVPT